jgi:hypothetical protein
MGKHWGVTLVDLILLLGYLMVYFLLLCLVVMAAKHAFGG